jgi:PAS domain S-box-containing protein
MADAHVPPADDERLPAPHATGSVLRSWARTTLTLAVAGILLTLGIANITSRARWHHIEDGVLWAERPEGVTAVEVASRSTGEEAGIAKGDVLLAVNDAPVQTLKDVLLRQEQAPEGVQLKYTLLRFGAKQAPIAVSLGAAPSGSAIYYLLAAVGLFTLIVGAAVRLRRPLDQATLHFFWLSVAFFGTFTFSFNGPFDRLDWVFYWGDAIATPLLPALLLHFTLTFPERQNRQANSIAVVPVVTYAVAGSLILLRAVAVAQGATDGAVLTSVIDLLDRAEVAFIGVAVILAVGILIQASREITSLTGRRQLRWIAWGTTLGAGPFALMYALPWALGVEPPVALQLTALPLAIVPLALASAIVRYRLRDVEIIVKSGLVYATFVGGSALLYFVLLWIVGLLLGSDPPGWLVALMATLVVVLLAQPVKQTIQAGLDRLFYRDRYDYRRALVGFARDLNSDLDVVRLSQRLVSRIVDTLVVDRMLLLIANDGQRGYRALDEYGFGPRLLPVLHADSSFKDRLDAGHIIALDGSDPTVASRFRASEIEFWRQQGLYYLVPCVFERRAIAVLALGREDAHDPFSSEDLALLTAVAGQVATAIENGRLYQQLQAKADEIGRMREFNENILESLDEGLVVFDDEERILRWNNALEHFCGLERHVAIGRTLGDLFDMPFIEALRGARREKPHGVSLFKVSLNVRESDAPNVRRLLVNATLVPLRTPSDPESTTGTILLLENITDRARLEEQLQISEKMASVGLLAAGVAHEVNTPLTGISSYTQMLLEGADPADPKTKVLEKIERQTFRAAKIVNGLLTLSRTGGSASDRKPIDLNMVIADVLSLLEHQLELSRVKVRRELSPTPASVVGAEHQLQQVFLNLFLNARDAMPRGGWMTVTTRQEGVQWIAEVADTGMGIPTEHLARIFDPFFTTKAIGRGTGLGLSISYGIVHEHGGEIQCDSAVGQGTRFTVRLPGAVPAARTAVN